jgi:hypothetical protein
MVLLIGLVADLIANNRKISGGDALSRAPRRT